MENKIIRKASFKSHFSYNIVRILNKKKYPNFQKQSNRLLITYAITFIIKQSPKMNISTSSHTNYKALLQDFKQNTFKTTSYKTPS